MFTHHHLANSFRTCLLQSPRTVASTSGILHRRGVAMTSSISRNERSFDAEPEFDEISDLVDNPQANERSDNPKSYREFMEKMGQKFMYAAPQQYLGETVEFILVHA